MITPKPPPSEPGQPKEIVPKSAGKLESIHLIGGRKMTWTSYGETGFERLKNWILSLVIEKYAKAAQEKFFLEVKSDISIEARTVRESLKKLIDSTGGIAEAEIITSEKEEAEKLGKLLKEIMLIDDNEMPRARKMALVLETIGDDPQVRNRIQSFAQLPDDGENVKAADQYLQEAIEYLKAEKVRIIDTMDKLKKGIYVTAVESVVEYLRDDQQKIKTERELTDFQERSLGLVIEHMAKACKSDLKKFDELEQRIREFITHEAVIAIEGKRQEKVMELLLIARLKILGLNAIDERMRIGYTNLEKVNEMLMKVHEQFVSKEVRTDEEISEFKKEYARAVVNGMINLFADDWEQLSKLETDIRYIGITVISSEEKAILFKLIATAKEKAGGVRIIEATNKSILPQPLDTKLPSRVIPSSKEKLERKEIIEIIEAIESSLLPQPLSMEMVSKAMEVAKKPREEYGGMAIKGGDEGRRNLQETYGWELFNMWLEVFKNDEMSLNRLKGNWNKLKIMNDVDRSIIPPVSTEAMTERVWTVIEGVRSELSGFQIRSEQDPLMSVFVDKYSTALVDKLLEVFKDDQGFISSLQGNLKKLEIMDAMDRRVIPQILFESFPGEVETEVKRVRKQFEGVVIKSDQDLKYFQEEYRVNLISGLLTHFKYYPDAIDSIVDELLWEFRKEPEFIGKLFEMGSNVLKDKREILDRIQEKFNQFYDEQDL